ncbi:MAG: preprotein translocase subunit SecA [Parabacteroides sp.]|nr:preprotein translocase subunit SecA [Parabacteroides sp.]
MGFNEFLTKLFGNKSQRDLKEITPYVEKVKAVYPSIQALSNDELRAKTDEIKQRIQDFVADERAKVEQLRAGIEEKELEEREALWAEIDKIEKAITDKMEVVLEQSLPEVFAIMKDTARRFAENPEVVVTANDFDRDLATRFDFVRIEGDKAIYANHWVAGGNEITWNMVHYDVQLFGGVVLHKGKIAEMQTGEGKTLVATLPVFLNALTRNGVHVVTVNDYLSKRDSEWMGPIYMFHGLSVDCIDKHQPNSDARRRAYNADITFGTNNEFGFDYLRDNMATNPKDLVQRKHNYAIVDEVDSVLIDDARTPLIISGPVPRGEQQLFELFRPNVEIVVNAQRNLCSQLLIEAKKKMASNDPKVVEEGTVQLYRSFKGFPRNKALIKFLSEQGVKAQMLKTEEYFMSENMRHMHEATDELYFVIDEKNNSVELTDKGIDLLTGNAGDPTFFVLPDITTELSQLENMEGTAEEKQAKKDEILANYSVKSERVHTVNQLLKAYTLFEKDDEYVVIDNKVMIVDEQTGRIMDGRRYSDGLHQAIEAKERVKVEAATQTFATITLQNYFRMYHKLSGMTGTAETEAGEFWDIYKLDVVAIPTNRPIARKDLNDRIYKTKREKYAAVIDEIVRLTEAGRPVLVGTTSVEISELLSRMLTLRKIKHNVLNAKLHQKEAEIVALAGQSSTVTIATNMAGRGTDIKLSKEVKDAGGLAIIGTERHESRRVDRQLRGRSGRQGDPGESRFYLSLEDDLMRLFNTQMVARFMARGMPEGEPIEAKSVSRGVRTAQKAVESRNYEIRKNVLKYDDVMNKQRTVIYEERQAVLKGEDIHEDILRFISDTVESYVRGAMNGSDKPENWDWKGLSKALNTVIPVRIDLDEAKKEVSSLKHEKAVEKLRDLIVEDAQEQYDQFETKIGAEGLRQLERRVVLAVLDRKWREHLYEMDYLKDGIGLRGMGQRDPLVEYQREGYQMYNQMIEAIKEETIQLLFHVDIQEVAQNEDISSEHDEDVAVDKAEAAVGITSTDAEDEPTAVSSAPEDPSESDETADEDDAAEHHEPGVVGPAPISHEDVKLPASKRPKSDELKSPWADGRTFPGTPKNAPCPCGSGRKYKMCHGHNEKA